MLQAVPNLRRLVAGFDPRSGQVGFVVDNVSLGAGFVLVFRFPLTILIPATVPIFINYLVIGAM
jgi:hypothetical protein